MKESKSLLNSLCIDLLSDNEHNSNVWKKEYAFQTKWLNHFDDIKKNHTENKMYVEKDNKFVLT